jgi:RNA polymerase sigma factor (sigma-70 family)
MTLTARRPRDPPPAPARGLDDFSSFYTANAERVLVFLSRRCLDPALALDLMAETFAQAYASRDKYRGRSDDDAAAWVFGIARHQLAGYFRRGRAERRAIAKLGIEVPRLDAEDQERLEELADLAALRAEVAHQFETLPSNQREALRLRVVDEVPYPEVARRLGVSEQTARARVSRGLKRLAAALERPRHTEGGVPSHES